ncbi:serine hydrolase domain-containing protein [Streptosporangium canum]|uniref:serine hydrolase domain-containing protein n=1 Tax=Streptosporangium canum TaxID=324952 RepID=UPI0034328285
MVFAQHTPAVSDLVARLAGPGEPGLSVGVYEQGDLVFTASAGEACVEFGVPVDARSRFDVASVSKQFTAVCALLLARDGRLDLDEDLRVHLPELRLPVPVTVRQCLQHTAGLPEWCALAELMSLPLITCSEERLMRLFARLERLNFAPGTDFSYSNTGYVLIAALVRRITGQSLAGFAAERIFAPLGMGDTLFRDDTTRVVPRLAYGYSREGRADSLESAVGDGGLVTSVTDLAPWLGFLADGRVLGADLRDALIERAVLKDGTLLPYGHGIFHFPAGTEAAFGHSGGVDGYRSQILHVPSTGIGVVVLANKVALNPGAIAVEIASMGAPARRPARAIPAGLTGLWHDPAADTFVEVTATESEITVDGEEVATDIELCLVGETLRISESWLPHHATTLVRCGEPGEAVFPEGTFRSAELDLAVTVDDGTLRLPGQEFPVTPAPTGAWRAGPATLRFDGDELLISMPGACRMRFTPQRF